MKNPIVHIVDDDEELRDALSFLFQSREVMVETYASAEDFIARHSPQLEGCIVLDVRMEGMSGLELLERHKALKINLPVILLTGHGDVPMAVEAIKKGAHDFIEKPFNDNELVNKVLAAIESHNKKSENIFQNDEVLRRIDGLSTRERQVMDELLSGKPNKVIAHDLNIVLRTVEVHRARIFQKMGVRGAIELANLIGKLSTTEIHDSLQS